MRAAEYLTDVEERLQDQIDRGLKAAAGLNEDQLNATRSENHWTIAQIFQHMILANERYLRAMEAAMAADPPAANNKPTQYTWLGRMLLKQAGPHGNAPAPKVLVPSPGPYGKEVVQKWADQTSKLMELERTSRAFDITAIRLRNPVVGLFKMNLADCFGILTEHTERHVRQIESLAKGS